MILRPGLKAIVKETNVCEHDLKEGQVVTFLRYEYEDDCDGEEHRFICVDEKGKEHTLLPSEIKWALRKAKVRYVK
ncbi:MULTISPECIES: hypothetical protein [Bacillus]|uniref:hypothetical protein n=1 Tax=Bacillus TaxID=1386 RepID=UPI0004695EA1|nr:MULTISPECIES: hypothetical protein [Bacillus]PEF77659.1 hypothetical protein CON80_30050 [Bacillus toyonensis]